MSSGCAHGENREYQVKCRDVLIHCRPDLTTWSGDGIDVPFQFSDTKWTFDVALRDKAGRLVLVECRRTVGAVKQEDMAAFAYKLESARRSLDIAVAGIFIAKRGHQIGSIKVGQSNDIQVVILEEGSIPPGFNITFLRYSVERESRIRDLIMNLPPSNLSITGNAPSIVQGNKEAL